MSDNQQKSSVHVEFYTEAEKNEGKSRDAGRPIFEDREFVRIKYPGDRNRELVNYANQPAFRDPATNEWRSYAEMYPHHYKAFKDSVSFHGDGTPLDELVALSNAQKAELRALNIFSIENLANLSHSLKGKLGMGSDKLINMAKAYLDKAAGSAVETRLAAENADLRAQMAALAAQVQALASGQTEEAEEVSADVSDSPFAGWLPADLKAYIKDATGAAPKGNPSRETLIRMADEANTAKAA